MIFVSRRYSNAKDGGESSLTTQRISIGVTDMTHDIKNPMGLDGFAFLEFSGPNPSVFEEVFTSLGFTPVAKHRTKAATLYRQGDIQFVLNDEPQSPAEEFAGEHGEGACAMGFRVKDADQAFQRAVEHGAQPVEERTSARRSQFAGGRSCLRTSPRRRRYGSSGLFGRR